jgi:hypothetical protein
MFSELLQFETRLYPNEYSEIGFLSRDQKLADVLTEDYKTVEKHGVTMYQIGCILERFVFKHSQGEFIVDDKYRIIPLNSTKGYQDCPFHELDKELITYGRSTIKVEKLETGETFIFESLVAHLVKEHGFCEGQLTPYRLDIEGAIRFFEIKPEIDYTPTFKMSLTPQLYFSSPDVSIFGFYISLSLNNYRNGSFIAMVLPANPTELNDKIESLEKWQKADVIEKWKLSLLDTIIRRTEKLGHDVSDEDILKETKNRLDDIKLKSDNFLKGIYDDLIVLIIGVKELRFPDTGFVATELSEKTYHFEIPSIGFNIVEPYYRFPSLCLYKLCRKINYD